MVIPQSEESLDRVFNSLNICNSLQEIELPKYTHPELMTAFQNFKNEFL